MYLTNKQQQQKSERKQQIAQFAIIISFFDFISLIETSEREREREKKKTNKLQHKYYKFIYKILSNNIN